MQFFKFLFPFQHMKKSALQHKRVGVLPMAFRAFRETGPRAPKYLLSHLSYIAFGLSFLKPFIMLNSSSLVQSIRNCPVYCLLLTRYFHHHAVRNVTSFQVFFLA